MQIRIRSKGQITLPSELRERMGLSEGDSLEVREEDGRFVLEPISMVAVPKDQAWFWEPDVQADVAEALQDVAAGRSRTFDSGEDFIADLERLSCTE